MNILPSEFLSLSLLKTVALGAGIFPASYHVSDGSGYDKRSDYQNGYNDAVMELSRHWQSALKWANSFPDNQKDALSRLVNLSILELEFTEVSPKVEGDGNLLEMHHHPPLRIETFLECNDIFSRACADAEVVAPENWEILWRVYEKYHNDGLVAFASRQRQKSPLPSLQNEMFRQATAFLNELSASSQG